MELTKKEKQKLAMLSKKQAERLRQIREEKEKRDESDGVIIYDEAQHKNTNEPTYSSVIDALEYMEQQEENR